MPETNIENKAIEKLKQDENFQKALAKYEEAEKLSQEHSAKFAEMLVDTLNLQSTDITIEQARFNLLVAKMTAAKLLATLSSFSYMEDEFMQSLINARKLIQDEMVPMLMNAEPCGECEACKNGHPERCISPKIRESYCESRFLPLIADALIEYDAWSEILYNSIPANVKDSDILQDIDDEFHDKIVEMQPKRKGRPPKTDKGDN